jgi:hypothetical protein
MLDGTRRDKPSSDTARDLYSAFSVRLDACHVNYRPRPGHRPARTAVWLLAQVKFYLLAQINKFKLLNVRFIRRPP